MKLFVLCFFAAFYMMFAAACSGSQANAAVDPASAQSESHGFGEKLSVRSVQQFQDRQPVARESGAPVGPRTITVVNFEADACAGATDRDFSIRVSKRNGIALAKIEFPQDYCSEHVKQSFRVGTTNIALGESVVVTNPTVVETLSPTE